MEATVLFFEHFFGKTYKAGFLTSRPAISTIRIHLSPLETGLFLSDTFESVETKNPGKGGSAEICHSMKSYICVYETLGSIPDTK